MAKEQPDFRKALDRLFKKSPHASEVKARALFESSRPIEKEPVVEGKGGKPSPRPSLAQQLLRRWRARPVVGIDLGAQTAKAVCVEHINGTPKVTGISCQEYPPEGSSQGQEEFLRQWLGTLKDQGLLPARAVFGVSDDRISIESLTMPKMPPEDLSKAVAWEVKERLNIDPISSCIRYLVLEEKMLEDLPHLELLVFVVPRQEVVNSYHLVTAQGGRVVAAEPGILACVAALESAGCFGSDDFVGVLDMGHQHSTLACVVAGKIRFIRSFSLAGGAITRSIAQYCKIDSKTAEEQKRQMGLNPNALLEMAQGDTAAVQVSHAMALYLERLATELDHSLRYVSYYSMGRGKASGIDRLYLVGGGALLKNLGPFLESRLNTKVEMTNPFLRCFLSEEVRKSLGTIQPAQLTQALGLALHPMRSG